MSWIPSTPPITAYRFNDLPLQTFVSVQCGGQGFDSPLLHQYNQVFTAKRASAVFRFLNFWRHVDVIARGPQSLVRPRSHLGRRESRVYAGSGNADVDYLSDGMTESLISSLSQLSNLNVKARSSVFRYKGREYFI